MNVIIFGGGEMELFSFRKWKWCDWCSLGI